MLFRKAVCTTLLLFVAFAVPLGGQLLSTWERPVLTADGPAPEPPPLPWADGPAPEPPPLPWMAPVSIVAA